MITDSGPSIDKQTNNAFCLVPGSPRPIWPRRRRRPAGPPRPGSHGRPQPTRRIQKLVMGSGRARARKPEAIFLSPTRPEPDFLKAYSIVNFGFGPKAWRPEKIFFSARPGPSPTFSSPTHLYQKYHFAFDCLILGVFDC